MKLVVFFLGITLGAGAQTNEQAVKLVHYVFDSFTKGTVLVKSGKVYQQSLNYNIITKEMIFENSGNYLAIADPKDVDTVTINHRRFIPVSDAFYEWLGGSAYPLFIEYTATVKEQGVNTGFGNSTVSAATSVKALLKDGGAYRLKLPDDFQIIPVQSFYVRKDSRYYKVNNEQQLAKVFPDKKKQISELVKANKTNFTRIADMKQLMTQLN